MKVSNTPIIFNKVRFFAIKEFDFVKNYEKRDFSSGYHFLIQIPPIKQEENAVFHSPLMTTGNHGASDDQALRCRRFYKHQSRMQTQTL